MDSKNWILYVVFSSLLCISLMGIYAISNDDKTTMEEIKRNYKQWKINQPNNYLYEVISGCMSLSKATVFVINGSKEVISERDSDQHFSIEQLFNNLIDEYNSKDDLKIEFNEYFNYPEKIFIDYDLDSLDDECIIEINKFKVIN